MRNPTVSFEMPPNRLELFFGMTVIVACLAITGVWLINFIEVLQKYQAIPLGPLSDF
jgi:hypothetical protein